MALYESFKDLINLAKKYDNKDLYEKILDLQEKANELQHEIIKKDEILQEKDKVIESLNDKLKIKENLIYDNESNCYYGLDNEENPTGQPYCSRCWEINKNAIHLINQSNRRFKICPECETVYVFKENIRR